MSRLIVIGEVNGDYTWLVERLEQAKLNKEDRVYFLGNHIGSAGQSAEVLEGLIQIHPFRKTYHIAGYRDISFRDWLMTGIGEEDEEVSACYGDEVPYSHYRFLQMMRDKVTEELPTVKISMTHDQPRKHNGELCIFTGRHEQEFFINNNMLNVGKNVIQINSDDYSIKIIENDYQTDVGRINVYG